jgi:2-polyprenyl-6-methoxyphenol hydroxylase-like FAD-dependent oxidoreductase
VHNRDVLISGAGIAGPTLAYWLGVAGFAPTVLERAPALRTGGYVVDFWGLGYDIGERMGLEPEMNATGYHMREMRVVNERGARVAGFGMQVFNELTGGRYVTLGRSDLSRMLAEKAKSNTEFMFGDEIADLRDEQDCVAVQFKHATERRFDLVIGADGLHSNVRRLAFGPQEQFEKSLGYMAAAFEVRGYRPRDDAVFVMYGAPGRMLGRVALHDDRTLFLMVAAGEAPPDVAGQKAVLREMFGDQGWECPQILAELEHAHDLYFDRVSQIRMDAWSRGRIGLIGDAAFCVSLLAGQGSALAMTSAYVLAGELARAEGQHDTAFRAYEARLRSFIAMKQKGALRFAGAFAPRTWYGLVFRNAVTKAFGIPGLSRLVIGRDIRDSLALPDYPWPAA